ncbi:MAG: hypothetical protein GY814_20330, partial [Gammaproteobacteria bacterium]|nr:hypothetical protein [Gammaproteobacteria bacterium]
MPLLADLATTGFPKFNAQLHAKYLNPIMYRLVTQINLSGRHEFHDIIQAQLEAIIMVNDQHDDLGWVLNEIQRCAGTLIKLALTTSTPILLVTKVRSIQQLFCPRGVTSRAVHQF